MPKALQLFAEYLACLPAISLSVPIMRFTRDVLAMTRRIQGLVTRTCRRGRLAELHNSALTSTDHFQLSMALSPKNCPALSALDKLVHRCLIGEIEIGLLLIEGSLWLPLTYWRAPCGALTFSLSQAH